MTLGFSVTYNYGIIVQLKVQQERIMENIKGIGMKMLRKGLPLVLLIISIITIISLAACSSGGSTLQKTTSATDTGNSVTLANFAFSPQILNVKAGTTVTWTNKDSATHTVTSDSGVFDSGNLATNSTFSYTFNSTGNFSYHCAIHPYITGTVKVQ
jgi:plastocyanin